MNRRDFLAKSLLAAPALLACSSSQNVVIPRAFSPERRSVGLGVFDIANPENIGILRELGITLTRTTLYWGNSLDTRQFKRGSVLGSFAQDLGILDAAGIDAVIVVHSPPSGMTYDEGLTEMPRFMAARAKQFPGR